MGASTVGEATIVSQLLEAGSDPNYQDQQGRTPLMMARMKMTNLARGKHAEVEEMLMLYGAK